MHLKKVAGTVILAGALAAGPIGFGVASAQADPGWGPDLPWIPGPGWVDWNGGGNWAPPPGQVKKLCPWNAPPGHWIGGPHGVPCT
ncbi:hypothetical protein BTO20_08990 [Mycobacterium dioxanotrophicus]|uniref:Secreted protein n=1 Tax=Mycobacterium dioxanotrophicus TaxID=482462 RepID=A0A1Y0C0J0_9MYCO|nr:hypothetical protein BTO20_08990 [Mycobacterium dioxanotrophicus]